MKNFIIILLVAIIVGGLCYLEHKNYMDNYYNKTVYIPSVNMNGTIINRSVGGNYTVYIIQLNNGNTMKLTQDDFILGETK